MDSIVSHGNPTTSSNPEPQDDMEFDSNEAAYEFYKEYAKSVGFGTAKLSSRRSRASKEFIDAKFSCIRYGNKQQSDDAINPRPSPKIGCKASMHVKRRPTGKWYIHSFVKEHNHELLPAQAHFFRSHRNLDPLKNDAKVRRRKVLAAVSKQYGAYQYMGSLDNYIRNQHDRGRTLSLEEGDAQMLLDFFVRMQEENPKFFYAVDLNEEHRLRNVFWVDAKGMDDYVNFGDVVCFDTTYFMNKYKVPLVLFVGVTHHIQPTLFGCALIADETVYTFVWLMQTWCLSMGSRAPPVILTDQHNAIKAAIAAVFPDTCHHYCLWNILDKIPRQLDYLSLWHDTFLMKFRKCIYKSWTEEEFERRWWKLVDRFSLREDEWIQSLYSDRKLWAPTFMKDISYVGLSKDSRSESLNNFFDKYLDGETCLKDFVQNYKLVLEDTYEEQAKADFDSWHETPELKSPSPFEKQLSLVYTHEIFKKFQVEVLGAAACHLKKEKEDDEGSHITYSVKDFEGNEYFVVEFNEKKLEICCSCRSFEYKGHLCRHAVVVLQMSGVFSIPFKYILKRWTNMGTSRHSLSERLDQVQSKVRRYNDLCRRAIILGEEGSLSQESYTIALNTIKEALKQCSTVNNTIEKELPLTEPVISSVKGDKASKCSSRVDSQKGKSSNDNNANKGKVTLPPGVNPVIQGSFRQLEQLNARPLELQLVNPAHLHNMVPTVFHNVASSQFHSVASTQLQNSRLPP